MRVRRAADLKIKYNMPSSKILTIQQWLGSMAEAHFPASLARDNIVECARV